MRLQEDGAAHAHAEPRSGSDQSGAVRGDRHRPASAPLGSSEFRLVYLAVLSLFRIHDRGIRVSYLREIGVSVLERFIVGGASVMVRYVIFFLSIVGMINFYENVLNLNSTVCQLFVTNHS